jgi:hypothetical protein
MAKKHEKWKVKIVKWKVMTSNMKSNINENMKKIMITKRKIINNDNN